MRSEWTISSQVVMSEGVAGAARFTGGKGRHGSFEDL